MVGESEKSCHCLPPSAGDQWRKLVLIVSAALLLLTFVLAIVFHTLFKSPWFIFAALLIPGAQTTLGIVFFDEIRASHLVVQPIIILQPISWSLYIAIFAFTLLAAAPDEVSLLISCVFLVWGGMFEIGLDLATRLFFPMIYAISAIFFVNSMAKKKNSLVWLWLDLIPVFLMTGMTAWRYYSANAVVPVEDGKD